MNWREHDTYSDDIDKNPSTRTSCGKLDIDKYEEVESRNELPIGLQLIANQLCHRFRLQQQEEELSMLRHQTVMIQLTRTRTHHWWTWSSSTDGAVSMEILLERRQLVADLVT